MNRLELSIAARYLRSRRGSRLLSLISIIAIGGVLVGVSALILIIGVILGFRPGGGFIGVLAAFALVQVFCFALAWLWIIVGMLMKTPESVMTMSFVFLMPLTFASDIFVQVATMPGWLQKVVALNPVTRLASASRGLMHGEPASADVIWVLIASAVIVAVAWPIAMRLYHKER